MEYEGQEFAPLSLAKNYYSWIFSFFEAYIGTHLLEHGAGAGVISEKLFSYHPEQLLLLEPASNLIPILQNKFRSVSSVKIFESTLESAVQELSHEKIDTIVSINVLEHVEHDQEELKLMYKLLDTNGHLLLFTPAFRSIYGSMDKKVGHYRRYRKAELKQKLLAANFDVKLIRYFNLTGYVTWGISNKLLKVENLSMAPVKIFDKLVPILRFAEQIISPPFGQSLVAVVQKR